MDALGDRMKGYEAIESDRRFIPLLPVIARLDGKCFHSYTKNMNRPYDDIFTSAMIETTKILVSETNALIGYTQSDEISLVYYGDCTKSQIFMDGRIMKMCSILPSMCTWIFGKIMKDIDNPVMPLFDCRVFQVPTKMEAANTILWRELDCTKNAITMAARTVYSDKELFEKNGSQKQEMLFAKGINFNDYPSFFKRGTYIQRKKIIRKFTTEEIDQLPKKHEARSNPDLMVERSDVLQIDMPPLSKVINRVEVIFNGENPVVVDENSNGKTE